MAIYIKDMEMPKRCDGCFAEYHAVNLLEGNCRFTGESTNQYTYERRQDCPLTEVPEPHGRLIDADACIDYIRNNNQHAWEALAYAPIVIEGSNNE